MVDHVYFIQVGDDGPVKIGRTALSVKARLSAIQTGCPYELKLIGVVDDATGGLEQELHRKFRRWRMRGEWFRPVPSVLAAAAGDYVRKAEKIAKTDEMLERLRQARRRAAFMADPGYAMHQMAVERLGAS